MALSLDGTTGISASGNIVGNNISVTGSFSPASLSASGNITGGNVITSGLVTATGNIQGGNVVTAGIMSSTGNAIHGNILTAGLISATGNITAAFLFGNASQVSGLSASKIFNGTSEANIGSSGGNANITIGGTSNVAVFATTGVFVTGVASASGNVTGGNITTAGLITATGNITGSFILGNGSQLTGIDATSIQSGTSNVRVVSAGGNVATGIGGTSNVVVVATTGQFVTGVSSASGNVTGGNITTAGLISATGNITGGNIITAGLISITGASQAGSYSASGNVTGGNITTAGLITATGNITGGNVGVGTGTVTVGNIVNSNANGVGNIGSASLYYNTVFAKATSAQYADVAEKYRADGIYPIGTVLMFGGGQEVTATKISHDTAIAGTVSENPSYIMNAGLEGPNVTTVALLGRVPCRVIGTIHKGDLLVSSQVAGVAMALESSKYQPGCVIGKSLENYNSNKEGIIEIVVGRL